MALAVPAAAPHMATAHDLAVYLGLGSFATGSADETQANLALRVAAGTVRTKAGQPFGQSGTVELRVPATADQWLALPPLLTGVSGVSVGGSTLTAGTGAGDYTLVGRRLFRYAGWASAGYGPPVVTLTATYSGDVPEDVFSAVLAIAADLFENPRGLSSETIGAYTWNASEGDRGSKATAALADVVKAYRTRPLTVRTA